MQPIWRRGAEPYLRFSGRQCARAAWIGVGVLIVLGLFAASPPRAGAEKGYVPAGLAFGSTGSGNGQLNEPTSVAVNSTLTGGTTGDVYVLDRANNRVEYFTSAGTYAGQFNGAQTPATSFAEPEGIAIDNSPVSSSGGDVYLVDAGHNVVDKFTAEGEYLGQLTETGGTPLTELHGVAVDASGSVWVDQRSFPIEIDEFNESGTFVKAINGGEHGAGPGIAVDSAHGVYVIRGSGAVSKYESATGTEVGEFGAGAEADALAVNPSTDNLLVDQLASSNVALYGRFGEPFVRPVQTFPSKAPLFSESHGIAVSGATSRAYASERGANDVLSFRYVEFPEAEPASVDEAGVVLRGSVNPEGEEVTECRFEFGPEEAEPEGYPSDVPCAQPTPFAGEGTKVLTADLSGLAPRTTYHFRLRVVISGETRTSNDLSLFTSTKPVVTGESVTSVGATQALVTANINAAGVSTVYHVDYGRSEAYEASTSDDNLGAPDEPASVLVQLKGLEASRQYHYRVVASNALGTQVGADGTFTTMTGPGGPIMTACANSALSGFDPLLPDCRAYELVSADSPGEVYVPAGPEVVPIPEKDVTTELPVRASGAGGQLAYIAEPGLAGGNGATGRGLGNEFRATREETRERWANVNVTAQTATGEEPTYQGFSSDLSLGILVAPAKALAQVANPGGPPGCYALFALAREEYKALFTKTETPGLCGFPHPPVGFSAQNLLFAGVNAGTTTVAPGSDILLQTPAPLVPGVEAAQEAEAGGNNLYVSSNDSLHLVNILPNGEPDNNAAFGAPANDPTRSRSGLAGVISDDGSRIFWTSLSTHQLYVRENASGDESTLVGGHCTEPTKACTVAASPGSAKFWMATSDGNYAFYTEGEQLWRFDVQTGGREALVSNGLGTAEEAKVEGVVGVSKDGAYLYFVAGGRLAENANSQGDKASQRACEEVGDEELHGHLPLGVGCNLYLLHNGHIVFIAALAAKDDHYQRERPGQSVPLGDWQPELGSRTAEVTPGGASLTFESIEQLTGYDNSSLNEGLSGLGPEHEIEAFVYDANAGPVGRLYCASCSPAGAPPAREHEVGNASERGAGTYLPISLAPTYMRRWLSDDGRRLFFDTSQPLVARDTNGKQDVYEWEQEQSSGCPVATSKSGGCITLLSGGDSSDASFLLDADSTGDNVFFTHRGRLTDVGQPEGKTDVYDARVDGGFRRTALGCVGVGCQGAPAAPPVFGAPSSVTFNGPGNLALPTPVPVKPKTAAQIRAQKLAKALKACRTKHNTHKHKRQTCEKRARKRYGPTKAKRASHTTTTQKWGK